MAAGQGVAAITHEQLKMLFALAREKGMDTDALHARAEAVTGQEHLSKLSKQDAARLIDSIIGKKTIPSARASNRVTQRQVELIFGLAKKLGWLDNGYDRIRGFAKAQYGVDVIDWLTPDQGRCCIEALKAILAGKRAERKRRDETTAT